MRRLLLLLFLSGLAALNLTTRAEAFTTAKCDTSDPDPLNSPHKLILDYTAEVGTGYQPTEDKACAYYGRGLIYHFIGKYDEAIADYSRAIGYMNAFGEAYAARGDAFEALGQHEKAKADYQEFWRLSQDNVVALNNDCWKRAIRGTPLDLALLDCSRALELDQETWYIWDSRCLVNYRLGNFAAAISDCDEAIKLRPRGVPPSQLASSQYVRGLAKIKNDDVDGGNQDIAAAKDDYRRVVEAYKIFGIDP